MKNNEMDLLSGSIGDKTLKFALPLAATGILQQLFNAADIAVVGNFVGSDAMGAVGANVPLINLIISLFIGISVGANVVIARYTGLRNDKAVNKSVHTSLLFAVICGVILTIICEVLSGTILGKMNLDSNIYPLSLKYFRVYCLGIPVILLYDFSSAVFRSRGNTRTPLICLVTSGVINVLLNLFFVIVMKMSVSGVALATAISNLISSALLIFFLIKDTSAIHFSVKKLGIDGKMLKQMIQIGLPAGFQGMVFAISNIIIQRSVNQFGGDVMAASSAAFNIEIFVYYILNAFGQACTTFVGQNYGAGKPERCAKTLKVTLLQDAVFTVVAAVLILSLGKYLLPLFNKNPAVVKYGMIRLKFILLSEFLNVIIEILSGWMRGFGYSFIPALICIIGICGVRITWVYTAFASDKTFPRLMTAYPISWTVTALGLIISYLYVRYYKLKGFFGRKNKTEA